MTCEKTAGLVGLVALLLVSAGALAQVPGFVNWSGRLTDGTAWGQSQTIDLTVRLYSSAEGGSALWQQEYQEVPVVDGYFSLTLAGGDNPATPQVENDLPVTALFADFGESWLTVCLEAPCAPVLDLAPRQAVGSVPYAVRVGDAGLLGGHPAEWYASADDQAALAADHAALAAALDPATGGAALVSVVQQLQAKLWCLENCDAAKLGDCQQRSCDGAGQKCPASGPAPDGTACAGGGRCLAGSCCDWSSSGFDCDGNGVADWTGLSCGGVACPTLGGYVVSCNSKQRCEYANADSSGWKQWDAWVWVPPGSFPMGSPDNEPGRGPDEGPVHTVTFAKGYFIGKYEIVVAQYEACMAANPSKCTAPSTADWSGLQGLNTTANGRSEHPQNGLTWQQSKDFCAWVAPGGRLPSEAEWEYSAKGPVHQKYPWGNSSEPSCSNNTAVFNEAGETGGYGCSQGGTWKVGSKSAGMSRSGALDMSGNVWEWNGDWYHNSYGGAPADGSAWVFPTGSNRVLRGGSFNYSAVYLRAAERHFCTPGYRSADLGARCWRPSFSP